MVVPADVDAACDAAVVVLLSRLKRLFLRVLNNNGRHHSYQRKRKIQMVKFSAQTELKSGISDFAIPSCSMLFPV